jgi:uncharacterized radical SAM superfamily Fe-S cluster-containing enzyme
MHAPTTRHASQVLRLTPQPELRVAFVYLHAQAGGDFFADVPFAWTAGELRKQGLSADLVHVHFERQTDPEPLTRALLDTLAGYGLVVVDQVWDPTLIGRIQAQGARVAATDPFAVWIDAVPDFQVAHFLTHRQPLVDLALALRDGDDLLSIYNLAVRLPGMDQPLASRLPQRPHPETPQALAPFCPVLDAIVLGQPRDEQGEAPPVRKTLDTNSGCPFSDPVEQNPAFVDVDLSAPGVTKKGCAFCFMGGDYKALPARDTVTAHLDQIAWYQAHLPRLEEVVLRDQSALRYLPELVRGAIARDLKPVGFLVPGRGDAILRWGPELREAAEAAQGTGFWFTLHLIGFESFSQAQLDLYNKGVTTDDYARALEQMRQLHAEFPDAFVLAKYGASSFILFNPWTTLTQLQETVDFCRDHAVSDLAHGLTLTRLRLYPNLPLYWKARQEHLLAQSPAPDDRGAAFTGYSAEAPWIYRDARIAAVEELQRRLHRHARVTECVGLLDTVLRWTRSRLPEPIESDMVPLAAEIEGIARDWVALRALWQGGTHGLGGGRPLPIDVERRRTAQSRTVLAGRHCNNHCRTCVAEHGRFETDPERLRQQVQQAAHAHGRVVLAGREPTLLPQLLALVQAAREAGATHVELVSNGRVLANAGVARRLQRAGVTDLVLKRHRLLDPQEDAVAQAQDAGRQFWQAIEAVRLAHPLRWTLLLVLTRGGEQDLVPLLERAQALGASAVQIQVPAAEVDLTRIAEVRILLEQALATANLKGLRCTIEGF